MEETSREEGQEMSETWIKLDVDFPTHPKILAIGPIAGWAFLAALCYSRRYLTDGHISYEALHAAYSLIEHRCGEEIGSTQALASLLEEVGLLEAKNDGWVIHDYAAHQQTKQMLNEKREALSRIRSEAGRKGGLAKAQANAKQNLAPSREVEQEQDLKSSSSTSPQDPDIPWPNLPSAAADFETDLTRTLTQLHWRPHQIGKARQDPERAEAWVKAATERAADNPGGYAWAGFNSGEWPTTPNGRTPRRDEAPTMIDAVSACQHFIEGHGWDDSFDEQAITEEFGRIERAARTTGTLEAGELNGLLEQWRATRQDRYGVPASDDIPL